ncbi:MAG TPA: lytic transglycosylase domain-containing protein [Mycobacteriales bacterium]|nr:lytic transglycosylase domain-containing protein [Mycobacteriales bacterium]
MPEVPRVRTIASVGVGALALSVVAATAAVAIAGAVGQHPTSTATTQNIAATRDLSAHPAPIGALHRMTPPDVVVVLRHSATTRQLDRLRHRRGIRSVIATSRGSLRVAHRPLHVIGVPLDRIRGLTPSFTAHSTALWQSIARGELTVGFADSRHLRRYFGKTVLTRGANRVQQPLRIGAFATIGLPGAEGMVASAAGAMFGLAPAREILVVAPKLPLSRLRAAVQRTLGRAARIEVTRAAAVNQDASSAYARQVIPSSYLDLYRRAAVTCPGLPWTVLAAIGTLETRNGQNVHTSVGGAQGPMQFLPSTWARWGYDADGNGVANINSPSDAVFSAARYLCAVGAGRGGSALNDAIYSYNHAWWYVREVVLLANRFA